MIDNFNPTIIDAPRPYYDNDPILSSGLTYNSLGTELTARMIDKMSQNKRFKRSEYKRGHPLNGIFTQPVYFDFEGNTIWWWIPDNTNVVPASGTLPPPGYLFGSERFEENDFSNWYLGSGYYPSSSTIMRKADFSGAIVTDLQQINLYDMNPTGFSATTFPSLKIVYLKASANVVGTDPIVMTDMNAPALELFYIERINSTDVDLSNLNAPNIDVIQVSNMNSSSSSSLNISNIIVKNRCTIIIDSTSNYVINASGLIMPDSSSSGFKIASTDCSLDMSNWDYSNVTNFVGMFDSSSNLKLIDNTETEVSERTDLSNITKLSFMFSNSSNIQFGDNDNACAFENIVIEILSNTATNLTQMFYNASHMNAFDNILSNAEFSAVTNASKMFQNAEFDTAPDYTLHPMPNCTNYSYMFAGTTVSGNNTMDFTFLDDWDSYLDASADFDHMFYNDNPNMTIIYPNWNGTFDANGTFTPNT